MCVYKYTQLGRDKDMYGLVFGIGRVQGFGL